MHNVNSVGMVIYVIIAWGMSKQVAVYMVHMKYICAER